MYQKSDKELVKLIRENNEDATLVLYERYYRFSQFLAKKYHSLYPNSGLTVDEITSIVFEAVEVAIKGFDINNEAFYTYWLSIASSHMLDTLASESYYGKARHLAEVSLDATIYEDERLTKSEVIGREDDKYHELLVTIHEIMLDPSYRFSNDERQAITLSCIEGYEVDEVARISKWSTAKAYKVIKRAKTKLADILKNVYL